MNADIKNIYFSIVLDYKQKIDEFNQRLEHTPYRCVFNNQLIDENLLANDIIAITVMDNPGVEEFANNKYLIGKAGKGYNKVISSLSSPNRPISRANLLVLNKSSFHTPATLNLNAVYEDENIAKIFLEEQIATFDVIYKIHDLLKIPLMVHGYTAYLKNERRFIENHRGGRPLYKFFELLFENYKDNEQIRDLVYFYHHSSYGCLEKQLRDYLGERDRDFEIFLELGKFNIKGFFD